MEGYKLFRFHVCILVRMHNTNRGPLVKSLLRRAASGQKLYRVPLSFKYMLNSIVFEMRFETGTTSSLKLHWKVLIHLYINILTLYLHLLIKYIKL